MSTVYRLYAELPSSENWKLSLKQMITSVDQLWELLQLPSEMREKARQVAQVFPLRVTREYAGRIEVGNINDPLLKQILPIDLELNHHTDFTSDPLQEQKQNPVPALLHKYHGRVLIIFSSACAIHCRYCFRREFPYEHHRFTPKQWQPTLDYLSHNSDISEVILSGGDPLMANDETLSSFILALEQIPHIKRLRIHSRLPIVLPSRVSGYLIDQLLSTRLQTILVIHSNHPQEIDESVAAMLKQLRQHSIRVLNQAVLLKGVNDSSVILNQLAEKLFELDVQFYYLHLLDKVSGTSHFDLEESQAKKIFYEMQALLPGYMLPKLVKEISGQPSKTLVT